MQNPPDFTAACQKVLSWEIGAFHGKRGYTDDSKDKGGETIAGISRRHHPLWPGWRIVDQYKDMPKFPGNLGAAPLTSHIFMLYRNEYWEPLMCERMVEHNIAEEVFEIGVHMGVRPAGRMLQRTINLLNRNGKYYQDTEEDSFVGDETIDALRKCLTHNPSWRVVKILNVMQGSHYIERMRADPEMERFVGWFDRI